MKTLILLTGLFLAQITWATGGTHCHLQTTNGEVVVGLGNGRLPGNPVIGGDAAVKHTATKTTTQFDYTDLVGWWSLGDELKMHFVKFQSGSDIRDTQLIVTANYSDVHETFVGMAYYEGPQGESLQEIIHCELE